MITKSALELLSQAVAIEDKAAKDAGALGFMARAMIQATMPHSKPSGNEFERRNGNYTLTMLSPARVGLPYGTIPRLLLAWISSEVVRTQERTLILGDSLSDFMWQLGMVPTGGRWGSITRLRSQMLKLVSCSISCRYSDPERDTAKKIDVADSYDFSWWSRNEVHQTGIWKSTLTLSEGFYNEVIAHPVPIDMRALKALKKSPLAIDVYFWLTYRMSYLSTETMIPWPLLAEQFGGEYGRLRDFKAAMKDALRQVLTIYTTANVEPTTAGLKMLPSKTHVLR